MSVFRLLTSCNGNFVGSRNLLSVSSMKNCDAQRASLSSRMLAKLGIPVPPKRPLTPYIRFLKELRPKVIQNQPDLKALDVVRTMAKEWAHCDPDKKQLWKKEFLAEMEVYSSQVKQYRESITPEQRAMIDEMKDKKKKARLNAEKNKKSASLGKPKKPMSAFLRFMQNKDHHNHYFRNSDYMKNLSEEWKSLSEEDREKYQKISREEMKKYQLELIAWEESMMRQGNIDVVRTKELLESKPAKKRIKEVEKAL